MGADTLLLCVQLSRLHTEVWEAVCHCGSQHQIERRACDRGTFRLVQGAAGALRRGTEKPEPLHIQQTDGEELSRKFKPPEPGYCQFLVVSVGSQIIISKKDKTFISDRKTNSYLCL